MSKGGSELVEFAFPGFLAFVDGLLLKEVNADSPLPATPRPEVVEEILLFLATHYLELLAETDPEQWTSDNPDLHVRVKGLRKDDTVVIEGVIKLWVTDKPVKKG